jgi:hypothetical protein
MQNANREVLNLDIGIWKLFGIWILEFKELRDGTQKV